MSEQELRARVAELEATNQRLANIIAGYRQRAQEDLEGALRAAKAAAWDEGHEDGQHNEHEHRPGRKITNPYREES